MSAAFSSGTTSSASAKRSGFSVPENGHAAHARALGRGDARVRVLDHDDVARIGAAEELERAQVALGVGLAVGHVVHAHHDANRAGQAGRVEDGLDLRARSARDDRDRHALGGVANRVPNILGDARAVRDGGHVQRRSLRDDLVDVRVLGAEPHAHDLRIGAPGQPVVVLLRRQRPAVLGEQVAKDLAQDRLVVRQRPVEVEDDGVDGHRRDRLSPCPRRPSSSRSPPRSSTRSGTYCSRARDTEAATAVAIVVGVIVFTPAAILTWDVDADVWPYVVGSTTFELAYIVLLAAAYTRSELSLVYPLARGLAPVLVLVVGVAALGAERRPPRPRASASSGSACSSFAGRAERRTCAGSHSALASPRASRRTR